ncbi:MULTISPECIES: YagK/YfjJ domain-containing protein [unclassified Moraxella]|uniref:YagK/YfjJ domain-containing protein n=1 Tax=unclassified Moraxella TaxID=2685852 RepID=UPI003AF99B80
MYYDSHLTHEGKLLSEVNLLVKAVLGLVDYQDLHIANLEGIYLAILKYLDSNKNTISLRTHAKTISVFIEWCLSIPQTIDRIGYINLENLRQFVMPYREEIVKENIKLQRQEVNNRLSLTSYIDSLICHYARLLFIRIDLSYKTSYPISINIDDFYAHFSLLKQRISNGDTCFKNLQGYAWALEQGVEGGYHCHLLLIYDGAKHQNDYYLAQSVGEAWTQITSQTGKFFNCNTTEHKQYFQNTGRLGIGMIHRQNSLEVKNALDTASYLVNPEKTEQFLMVRPNGMRTFGKGQFNVGWRRGIAS